VEGEEEDMLHYNATYYEANGGVNGTTNSPLLILFPPNGAITLHEMDLA